MALDCDGERGKSVYERGSSSSNFVREFVLVREFEFVREGERENTYEGDEGNLEIMKYF